MLKDGAATTPNPKLNRIHAFALGIIIVFGGFTSKWTTVFSAGFGGGSLAIMVISLGYCCLCLCISTMNQYIPFAGGAYGLARCSLGYYLGFMVGCCELFQYVLYSALFTLSIVQYTTLTYPITTSWVSFIMLLILFSSVVVKFSVSHRAFFVAVIALAIIEVIALCILLLSGISNCNFSRNALTYRNLDSLTNPYACTALPVENRSTWFIGGGAEFFKILPVPTLIFVGIEALNMLSNETKRPKCDVPCAQMRLVYIVFGVSICFCFLTASLPPGGQCIAAGDFVSNTTIKRMLHGDEYTGYFALSIPPLYGTVVGFIWAAGKMLSAMSSSALFPVWNPTASTNFLVKRIVQHSASIIVTLLSFACCQLIYRFYSEHLSTLLMHVGLLFACVAYISQSVAYLRLTSFGSLHLLPRSDLVRAAAWFSLCLWIVIVIAVIFFEDDDHMAITIFAVSWLTMTVYYFCYGKYTQSLSGDEQKYLYAIHLINYAKKNNKVLQLSRILLLRAHTRLADQHLIYFSPSDKASESPHLRNENNVVVNQSMERARGLADDSSAGPTPTTGPVGEEKQQSDMPANDEDLLALSQNFFDANDDSMMKKYWTMPTDEVFEQYFGFFDIKGDYLKDKANPQGINTIPLPTGVVGVAGTATAGASASVPAAALHPDNDIVANKDAIGRDNVKYDNRDDVLVGFRKLSFSEDPHFDTSLDAKDMASNTADCDERFSSQPLQPSIRPGIVSAIERDMRQSIGAVGYFAKKPKPSAVHPSPASNNNNSNVNAMD